MAKKKKTALDRVRGARNIEQLEKVMGSIECTGLVPKYVENAYRAKLRQLKFLEIKRAKTEAEAWGIYLRIRNGEPEKEAALEKLMKTIKSSTQAMEFWNKVKDCYLSYWVDEKGTIALRERWMELLGQEIDKAKTFDECIQVLHRAEEGIPNMKYRGWIYNGNREPFVCLKPVARSAFEKACKMVVTAKQASQIVMYVKYDNCRLLPDSEKKEIIERMEHILLNGLEG